MKKTIIFFKGIYDTLDLFTDHIQEAFLAFGFETFVYHAGNEEQSKETLLKLVDGAEFDMAKRTTAATKLKDDDELMFVSAVTGEETLVMQSGKDLFLRIEVSAVSEQKKASTGVRGMKLENADVLVNYYLLAPGMKQEVEVKGKIYDLSRLHIGTRDSKGTKK